MSDAHAWAPTGRAEDALREFAAYRDRLRDLVHQYSGDDNEPVRSALKGVLWSLDDLDRRMRVLLIEPTPLRRVPGEQTDPTIRRHRKNSGWDQR